MKWHLNFIFTVSFLIVKISTAAAKEDLISNKTFPSTFKFGAATAAYQVEGGWNADGKGENIWDRLVRTNASAIKNNDNGDISCDSYHKYKEDVLLLKNLGVQYYRFSLSWSRIFPYGFTYDVNEAGVNYYKNLIDELLDNNIEPLVTLFHWDLPQPLQDIGGWPNEALVDIFAEYARFAFNTFGEKVKNWLTFNEIMQICELGYGFGALAPMIQSPGIGDYLCTHNVLKSHAKAWHIYDEEFRSKQQGRISVVIDTNWFEPASNKTEDEIAAETRRQFSFGWFANPIYHGNYPKVMIERIANRSKLEGFNKSRLPEFTKDEIQYINGTYDFMALNTYSAALVQAIDEPEIGTPSYRKDIGVNDYQPDEWEGSTASWLKITPWAIRKLLVWLKRSYNNPEIIITENGYADNGTLNDDIRINYLKDYLSNILDAITEDEVNVTHYTVWSLLDNLEWTSGYSAKFGLYQVDFSDPNRTRTPKNSVEYYKKVIKTHCLVENCE